MLASGEVQKLHVDGVSTASAYQCHFRHSPPELAALFFVFHIETAERLLNNSLHLCV
jgi:hypothetical protein